MWGQSPRLSSGRSPLACAEIRLFKVLRASLFLLLLHSLAAFSAAASGQISSVGISPDGKFIAVTYENGHTSFIYKIDADTGGAARLTDAKTGVESSPSFSPDGKRIAFSYSPGNGEHSRIIIGNLDGSDLHPWSPSEASDFRPLFSPDNKTIIFARSGYYGSYSPIAQPYRHDWNFLAAGLDGANPRQLTNEHFYMVSDASVSPDGKSLVFVSSEDHGDVIEVRSVEDPAKPMQILRPRFPKEPSLGQLFNCPNYMPDGKSILFLAASNGKSPWSGYDYDVYQMDIATGAVERLTTGDGYATDLKVSADGKIAVFLKWRSDWHGTPNKSELYLLDLQTRKLTPFKITGLN
jgi:Tol biopolymer transport system component